MKWELFVCSVEKPDATATKARFLEQQPIQQFLEPEIFLVHPNTTPASLALMNFQYKEITKLNGRADVKDLTKAVMDDQDQLHPVKIRPKL